MPLDAVRSAVLKIKKPFGYVEFYLYMIKIHAIAFGRSDPRSCRVMGTEFCNEFTALPCDVKQLLTKLIRFARRPRITYLVLETVLTHNFSQRIVTMVSVHNDMYPQTNMTLYIIPILSRSIILMIKHCPVTFRCAHFR